MNRNDDSISSKMDELGIEDSPRLRNDLAYLWQHGYETVLSHAGHRGRPAEEARVIGLPPGTLVPSLPYISYIKQTGDGLWEEGEGRSRGWEFRGESMFRPDRVGAQYQHIKEMYGPEIPVLTWMQGKPLKD